MSELKYWIWLKELRGLSNQTRLRLVRRFDSLEALFYADSEEILLTEGMTREQASCLEDHDLCTAEQILADCQRLGQRIITIRDTEYPDRLRNIYNPPLLLYIKGRMPVVDDTVTISVVGTRNCTPYGISCTEKLAYGLGASGAIVVSGLAKGIDAAASRGALRAGGVTIGVLGNGIDVHYPYQSEYLYEDIPATGVLISEYPPGTKPTKQYFPERNRIISGLSLGTLIVEAPERSGALITAGSALEQGRDVFVVPGPIDSPYSKGCNRLIREGAILVTDASEILQEYENQYPEQLQTERSREKPSVMGYRSSKQPEAEIVESGKPLVNLSQNDLELTDDQIELLRVLSETLPVQVDDLIEKTGIPTRRVLSALTLLEIEKLVTQHSGKYYTRAVTLTE